MKAIIMAAGVGKRLLGLNMNKPKCLLTAGSETLIRRSVNLLVSKGISDITVIVGYEADLIRNELKNDVAYFENPYFLTTNSIMSLWYAKDLLEDNVLLLNGDLYYEHGILDYAKNQTNAVVMLADSTRIDNADYRFGFIGDQINRYGKHLTNQETDGEYVGIVRIDKCFINTFKQTLEEMITAGKSNIWWEDVLYSFISKQEPIHFYDVAGTFWSEVDTLQDYNYLQNWITNQDMNVPREIIQFSSN
ncbi:MAG TPA: phosphocholine cytidylyltransferase family protein [Candidatus Marinimicrobia bacterium]|jgi:choline kinase|nr:phosphocholine cytidylyltransferase family protein [Candidatus Neomarinimicrobiota bacterium]|tara:strand:+ start:387 stop:1130 length:744 start_codon:yes stop_codon:yes gene_type:complete